MSNRDDYYSFLGVPATATLAQLKERYRFLCHAFHPDKFPSEAQRSAAESEFKGIQEAYRMLSDPDRRAQYDAARSGASSPRPERPPPPPEPPSPPPRPPRSPKPPSPQPEASAAPRKRRKPRNTHGSEKPRKFFTGSKLAPLGLIGAVILVLIAGSIGNKQFGAKVLSGAFIATFFTLIGLAVRKFPRSLGRELQWWIAPTAIILLFGVITVIYELVLRPATSEGPLLSEILIDDPIYVPWSVSLPEKTTLENIEKSTLSRDSYSAANAYLDGKAVQANPEKATHLLQRAANAGVFEAQVQLGYLYETGRGVPRSLFEAYKWYVVASKNGYVPADGFRARVVELMTNREVGEGWDKAQKVVVAGSMSFFGTNEPPPLQHVYGRNGPCARCGGEKGVIEKSNKPCVVSSGPRRDIFDDLLPDARPKQSAAEFLDAPAPIPPTMSLISAGSFMMGGRPVHSVQLSAFHMDRHEVTKALWDDVKRWSITNGYIYDNPGLGKAPNHPVHSVSWFDAVKWCNARSQKEGRTPAYYTDAALTQVYQTGQATAFVKWNAGYRLPTEAEWEKAAKGGASRASRFPWDNLQTISHSQANYSSSATAEYDILTSHLDSLHTAAMLRLPAWQPLTDGRLITRRWNTSASRRYGV